jgi:hypothetical protein
MKRTREHKFQQIVESRPHNVGAFLHHCSLGWRASGCSGDEFSARLMENNIKKRERKIATEQSIPSKEEKLLASFN